jgi:hypothetical protein
MGIFDYVSDLYAAMSIQTAEAEEPQKDDGKATHDAHPYLPLATIWLETSVQTYRNTKD